MTEDESAPYRQMRAWEPYEMPDSYTLGPQAAARRKLDALNAIPHSNMDARNSVPTEALGSVHRDTVMLSARATAMRMKRRLGERAPLNRTVSAAEVANAVLFLASDDGSDVQATDIVDGGTTGALARSPRYMRGEAGSPLFDSPLGALYRARRLGHPAEALQPVAPPGEQSQTRLSGKRRAAP